MEEPSASDRRLEDLGFRAGIGRDRTGLVAFLLQAIIDVPAEAIAQDWSHSIVPLNMELLTERVSMGLPHDPVTSPMCIRRFGLRRPPSASRVRGPDLSRRRPSWPPLLG